MPIAWLDPKDTGFGCSVLDVRDVATQKKSNPSNPQTAAVFMALRNSNGADLRDLLPGDGFAVPCNLSYPVEDPIDGPLYKAAVLEHKWDIYLWDRAIYITRSWTGTLTYVAHLGEARDRFHVERITADRDVTGYSPHLARRQVDFILRSHYYQQDLPHPLPDDLPEDPTAIARYSFHMFGARGLFATYADTTEIHRDSLGPPRR